MPLIRRNPETSATNGAAPDGDAIATLASADPAARRDAARALAATLDGAVTLGAALGQERDPAVREAILTGLVRAGSREAVEAVLPHLRSDDAALRTAALDALRAMPRAVESRMPALLSDPDPDVRLLACEIAREFAPEDATALLCDLLDRDAEPNVCASAAEVLAEVGSPEALPALARCAERFAAEPFLVFALRAAADRIRTQPDGTA
jgi:HEAT repeat protein